MATAGPERGGEGGGLGKGDLGPKKGSKSPKNWGLGTAKGARDSKKGDSTRKMKILGLKMRDLVVNARLRALKLRFQA